MVTATSPWRRLGMVLRGTVPLLVSLVLVLVSVVPYPVPDIAAITPFLAIIAVYYWSIYRPELLPASAVFLIGLVQDVLTGNPVGMTSFVLLLVHGVVLSQRRVFVGKSFFVGWWGFAMVASGAAILSWIVASLWFAHLVPAMPVLYQTIFTIILYPCVVFLFGALQTRALRVA